MTNGYAPPDEPGRRVGRREDMVLKEVIGQGATGAIWRAWDDKHDREVAIKFMKVGAASDATQRARFVREGKRFGGLRHENLIRVHQLGEWEGRLYLVLEYVEGRNIHQILVQDGPFDVEDAIRVCRDVASGLQLAHEHHVIHRDLKPANIMIRRADACVKVLDFGIAKDLSSDTAITKIGMFVGTPAYSAPEQITGSDLDARTDIYSLGVIFYEMLSGPIDFGGRHSTEVMRCTLREKRVPLTQLFDLVTRPVARLIQRMTRKHPGRRPESMTQVVAECDRLLEILQNRCAEEDRSGIHKTLKGLFEAETA